MIEETLHCEALGTGVCKSCWVSKNYVQELGFDADAIRNKNDPRVFEMFKPGVRLGSEGFIDLEWAFDTEEDGGFRWQTERFYIADKGDLFKVIITSQRDLIDPQVVDGPTTSEPGSEFRIKFLA